MKNAPRVTIGNAKSPTRGGDGKGVAISPGPSNYRTETIKQIGDAASVKVVFASAQRPISAQPGERLKRIQLKPGPSDYNPVNTEVYMKRSRVIP
tara:strand:+ start:262 stop:546 length:285 start_codon:yes stop_codon:yes gene_type:complete